MNCLTRNLSSVTIYDADHQAPLLTAAQNEQLRAVREKPNLWSRRRALKQLPLTDRIAIATYLHQRERGDRHVS